jgi:hypothetical protein
VTLKWFTQQVGNRAQRLQTELLRDRDALTAPLTTELTRELAEIAQEFAKTA